MSIYALPSTLFPPLEKSFDFSQSQISVDDFRQLPQQTFPAANSSECVSIYVRRTWVDHNLLIETLTGSKRPPRCTSSSRRPASRKRNHQWSPEVAMKFELEIRRQGQSYAATRNLAQIRQLQFDIAQEASFTNWGTSCQRSCFVPPFPIPPSECRGLCFTLLHKVLQGRSPALNQWFQHLLAGVTLERSPSLSDFLYEPVPEDSWSCLPTSGSSGLESIEESDSQEEE